MPPKTSLRLKLAEAKDAPDVRPAPGSADRESAVSSADYLFHLLAVISRLRDAELDRRLQGLKLNVGRYRVLATIDLFGPCTMSTFASYSPLDRTTNTRTIDHLVRAGWVSRSKAAEDRRQIYISLTDAGRQLYHQAKEIISKHNSFLIDGIGEDLQAQIIAAELMLAFKLEPKGGQFVDRQSQSEPTISKVAMVS